VLPLGLALGPLPRLQASESYQIVRCRGCETISFRSVSSNSEDLDYAYDGELEYLERKEVYPPRLAGRPKLKDDGLLPYDVENIYKETHAALCTNLPILAAVGIRALVEAVCAEEEAKGANLEKRIDSLVASGVLTPSGAQILHGLRFMGNEAAHEIKRHSPSTLGTAFDVAENLLQNVYILPEKASRFAKRGASKPRQ
jgi:Domain of unknown function (DUF4145)